MRIEYLRGILERDLRAVVREIETYPDEAGIWLVPAGVSNSAGTLVLHLAGNLQAYIGAALGGSGYERDRPSEFARRDVSRGELVEEIERAIEAVGTTLRRLPEERLAEPYPLELGGVRLVVGDFLMHLAVHLGYHLGQIDYHRRLVTGMNATAGTVGLSELASAEPGL